MIEFVMSRPDVLGVLDMRDLRPIQEADVDIGIKSRDGRVMLAEIKSDSYLGTSGNILFEVLRINHTAPPDSCVTLGWSGRTPAKYILYYAPAVNKIYRFDTDKLREAFQEYTRKTGKAMRISIVETDSIKTTINILVPIEYCNGNYVIYDL